MAVCDAVRGLPFADNSVDTIFCCSVLEHVTDPPAAMAEFARVLRPNGRVILSIPFMYFLHGAPNDFFRFTRFGVELMARRSGLSVETVTTSGGLAHLVLHTVSMVVAGSAGSSAAGLSIASLCAGLLWRIARFIDRFDRSGRLAQNINAVLIKP
jgi:SAM-dependent methyltransferase